jgi:hypothetical protein
MRYVVLPLLVATFATWADPLLAQNESALAESLFQEGKVLLKNRSYPEACAKFAESQRLDPGSGTLFALATCHELEGKTATAWGEYSETVALATRAGRADRVEAARAKVASLQNILPTVTLRLPAHFGDLPGSTVSLNGKLLGKAAWSTKIPIDPGALNVDVFASGKERWQQTYTVTNGSKLDVVVPDLRDAQAPKVAVPTPPLVTEPSIVEPALAPKDGETDIKKPLGYGGIVLGGLSVGAGAVLGGLAISASNEVRDACPNGRCLAQGDVDRNARAGTFADASTVLIPVGLLLAGVGIALVISSKSTTSGTAMHLANGGLAW